MLKILLLTTAILAAVVPVSAMAQSGQCASPTTIAFPDLPDMRGSILPSIHRQLSSIGRAARTASCTIELTCVSAPGADEEARRIRNRQCTAAAQAIVRYEARTTVRAALQKAIVQVRATAGDGLTAGTVYVSLK